MTTVRAAFYARVSSEQQAAAHTIENQISALSERARSDGATIPPERQFVDNGISGATLARPALDRLRDLAAVGAIDRIYVHSPDRLARFRSRGATTRRRAGDAETAETDLAHRELRLSSVIALSIADRQPTVIS